MVKEGGGFGRGMAGSRDENTTPSATKCRGPCSDPTRAYRTALPPLRGRILMHDDNMARRRKKRGGCCSG